jgi:hypothetical protein
MSEYSPYIENARELTAHNSDGRVTRWLLVSLTLDAYAAAFPATGGGGLDETGPFQVFRPTRLPQINLGAGGVATVYTLTGTRIDDRADEFTQTINATGAGDFVATEPMNVTRLQSDVDPQGVTTLQAGATWVYPPARALHVDGAGTVIGRPEDNDVDITRTVLAGVDPTGYRIIRIGGTATGLLLGW